MRACGSSDEYSTNTCRAFSTEPGRSLCERSLVEYLARPRLLTLIYRFQQELVSRLSRSLFGAGSNCCTCTQRACNTAHAPCSRHAAKARISSLRIPCRNSDLMNRCKALSQRVKAEICLTAHSSIIPIITSYIDKTMISVCYCFIFFCPVFFHFFVTPQTP